MTEPLISILIPMYNAEKGIGITLESLKRQTFQDFEIIIVNDGSTDNSVEAARTVFPQATIHEQENLGIAVALNHGLQHCAGKFIARIDCQDTATPERLELQVKALQEHPDWGLVGGNIMLVEKDGRELGVCRYPQTPGETRKELLRGNPSVLHTAAMLRASVLKKTGFYDPFFNGREDFELWCRISLLSEMCNVDMVVMRSLSTAEGLSFSGMNLAPLIDLALLEREERVTRGMKWKNELMRQKTLQTLAEQKQAPHTEEQHRLALSTFHSRRGTFLLRSGERRAAWREFREAARMDRRNFRGLFGLFACICLPVGLYQRVYRYYRR